jgi:hypothetical protein
VQHAERCSKFFQQAQDISNFDFIGRRQAADVVQSRAFTAMIFVE